MHYWLVKSEPKTYSFADLKRDKKTIWDGVRNFQARNNLRAMKKGDLILFYHSNEGKDIVGISKVVKEAYPDPTAKQGDWSVVEIAYVKDLKNPISLAEIKGIKILKNMQLVTHSRLSVQSVSEGEFKEIERLTS